MTQEKLAEIIDKSVNYVSMMERGERPVSLATAKKINEQYGYRIDFLTGESRYPKDEDIMYEYLERGDLIESKIRDAAAAVLYNIGYRVHEQNGLSEDKKSYIHYAKVINNLDEEILITGEQLDSITDSIEDFIEFSFRKLFLRKNNEQLSKINWEER